jgi:hypothetical protein
MPYPKGFNVLEVRRGTFSTITWYTPGHYDTGPMYYIMDDFGNAYSPFWRRFA